MISALILLAVPVLAEPALQPAPPVAPSLQAPQQPPAPPPVQEDLETRKARFAREIKAWFMDDSGKIREPELFVSSAEADAHVQDLEQLYDLKREAAFMRKGRVVGQDDFQSYSDMAVLVARQLGVKPPEAAIPLYRGRVRPASDLLTADEQYLRADLLAASQLPGVEKRYLFISDLVGSPTPEIPKPEPRVVYVKVRRGKKYKTVKKVIAPPETAPPPKDVSVISQVDWEKADELAEVADDNAHGWDRKPKESLRRYRRRLRRLRAHCYEWVRRDLTALGIWDAQLFRGYVPPTRKDRKRPIRAASFAIAMSKIESKDDLAAKTTLRQLNLRVDPLVRGAIVVFSQSVCGYDPRNGHIEIITSVDPLQAASFKFHPVKMECLVEAANTNKVHIYVPLKTGESAQASGTQPGR